jgi:hypothetical protein
MTACRFDGETETDIAPLIRMRLLKGHQRHDVEALQTAVTGLLYRAEDVRGPPPPDRRDA